MKKPLLILFILILAIFGLIANDRPAVDLTAPAVSGGLAQPQIPTLPSPGSVQEPALPGTPGESPAPEVELPGLPSLPVSFFAGDYADKLQISELMPKNKAALADPQGQFPDWCCFYYSIKCKAF